MHDAVVHLHFQLRSCSSRSRLHRRLAQAVAPRRKTESEIVALIVAGIPLMWVSTGLVVSFATTPLILVLIRLRREQQRRELYLAHVVGPSVREALRKVEGKVVTGQAGASEPHVSLPYPARLVCRFGSATTADYDEYLAEKKIDELWKPEVEVDSKFLPKH